MKLISLGFALLLAFLVIACGHEHSNNTHTHDGDGHSHDGDDEHSHTGERESLGKADYGDGYSIEVTIVGHAEAGKEIVFEVVVTKDGKPVTDAGVTCQVTDDDGNEYTASLKAEWDSSDKFYDVHLTLAESLPKDFHLEVRLRIADDFDQTREFELTDHEH